VKRASITEAKNRLSALLDRVRHGETVIIEDRGIAIAQITAVAAGAGPDRDRLARLERQGILRPAARAGTRPAARSAGVARRLPHLPPRPEKPVALSDLVRRERAEGR
jgi:prevent-host-death family protein